MHLAIDVREACAAKRAGKGQWTYGFVSELLSRDMPMTLLTDADIPVEWKKIIDAKQNVDVRVLSQKGLRWHLAVARAVVSDGSIDAYVSTVSYIVPALIGRKKKVATIVHDLIAFMNEPHDRKATCIERLLLPRVVRTSSTLLTVSDTTKYDLLARYRNLDPSHVHAIFAGPVSHSSAQNTSDGKTILCVGTLCPRKNQERLIEAFASLCVTHPDARLTLVGKRGWNDDDIMTLARSTKNVEWKNYVTDNELDELMRTSAVLAFPSLYEGFGMPILDAMRIGLPVVTSNVGSMKEVADDAAVLVDSHNIRDIANGIRVLLDDAPRRAECIEKGKARAKHFDWARTVDLFLEGIRR